MLSIIDLELDSEVPIVGCELTPKMRVSLMSNTVTTASDVLISATIDGHFLRYTWSRVENDKKAIPCYVHPLEPATIQCTDCGMRKGFVAKSYHCSSKCFQDAWPSHMVIHEKPRVFAEKEMETGDAGTPFSPQLWKVGESRTYIPTTEDVGHVLRLECAVICAETKKDLGRSSTISTPRVVPFPTPFPRKLVPFIRNDVTRKSEPFTVLTYNILSDTSASDKQYDYCQPWARTWTYRKHNLLQEIFGYNADVVCLQEVQNSHLDNFFAPELKKLGYDFRYQRRTSKLDGCATFFKQKRFSFVKEYSIEFDKIAKPLVGVDPLASKRLLQNNIALLVVLEFVDPSEKRQLICVINTHLEVKQDFQDVMLWHVNTLLKGIAAIGNSANGIPMIICGDFNMIPESASHFLVILGKVDPSHQDVKVDPHGILQPLQDMAHDLPLVSAYSAFWVLTMDAMLVKHKMRVNSSSKEPMFTKYTKDFKGCNDYIFYTAKSLRVESLLELVEKKEVVKDKALPSPQWPSSHIALLAQFCYIPPH